MVGGWVVVLVVLVVVGVVVGVYGCLSVPYSTNLHAMSPAGEALTVKKRQTKIYLFLTNVIDSYLKH